MISMSLEKAFCPYCGDPDNKLSIFDAIPDADVCYCPYCMTKLNPNQAINAFNNLMAEMVKKADKVLYEKTDFLEAYHMFGRIIEINPDSFEARCGRLLSLLFLSTLRKSRMKDFLLLLDSENEYYLLKAKDKDQYIVFLQKADFAIDEYDKRFRKRITVHRYFYNVDCIKLYLERIKEILTVKEYILEQLESFNKKDKHYQNQGALYVKIRKDIAMKQRELADKYVIGDGTSYKLVEFTSNGNPLLARNEHKVRVSGIYSFNHVLEQESGHKKQKVIKDRVYPDNTHFYRLIKLSVSVIFLLLIAVLVALAFAYFGQEKLKYAWIGYIVSGASLFGAIVLVALRIAWKRKVNSRRHLIE